MAHKETSLFELCSICYTEKPKYRCPRCKSQTCSLACYKRHQQRANCSGQRDPAAYVKKSQLATPAGIDRDYNYLKSVEREIDHASKDTVERGIGNRSATSKVFNRGVHPEGSLQRYLVANRIVVNRAPTGMSRQQTNQTRYTKRGRVMWTVEWVNEDGSKELQENSLESSTISELHALMRVEQSNAAKRKLAVETSSNQGADAQIKRPRVEADDRPERTDSSVQTSHNANQPIDDTVALPDMGQPGEHVSATGSDAQPPGDDAHGHEQVSTSNSKPSPDEPFFYLFKPGTPSSSKVVIPLPSNLTLTQALQDKVVLEYPTIHILRQDQTSLPPGFMTEEQFLAAQDGKENGSAQTIEDKRSHSVVPSVTSSSTISSRNLPALDSKRILDMLKRDITS